MPELQQLSASHAPAVLDFEQANRAWFARSINDRGEEYFARFADQFADRLAEQADGISAFYVLVDEDGAVLGRFNLVDIEEGTADLGYRVAEHVAGQGVATATVRELCRVAVDRHGVRRLRAAVSLDNVASQRVLIKAGFAPVGPADPADVGGKVGTWYECDLVGVTA